MISTQKKTNTRLHVSTYVTCCKSNNRHKMNMGRQTLFQTFFNAGRKNFRRMFMTPLTPIITYLVNIRGRIYSIIQYMIKSTYFCFEHISQFLCLDLVSCWRCLNHVHRALWTSTRRSWGINQTPKNPYTQCQSNISQTSVSTTAHSMRTSTHSFKMYQCNCCVNIELWASFIMPYTTWAKQS